jgi:hypothetical protein
MSGSDIFDKKQIDSEVYTKAQIHREELSDKELKMVCNEVLKGLGADLSPNKEAMQYLGSAAIHVYKPKTLDGLMFISQTGTMHSVPENIASKGIEALKNDMMVEYGRRRRLKRSGF